MSERISAEKLVEQAMRQIETISVSEAIALADSKTAALIDLRDPRELTREGRIPTAHHAPRGMLEFWLDPTSPYHNPIFSSGKKLIFFCAKGWRSALAVKTAQDMGQEHVCHFEGGFSAWCEAGGPVERE